MKKFKIIIFLLLLSTTLKAQGIMNFEKEVHDFGTIKEGTMATYEFVFTNTGNQAIEITRAKPACGCTTPSFTKNLIFPGQEGKIKVVYNSNSRPGQFMKSVTIRSNAKKPVQIIYVKGFVLPRNKANQVGVRYKEEDNDNRLPPTIQIEKYEHDFGKIASGTIARQRFTLYNSGQKELRITGLENESNEVSFGLSKGVINPSQQAYLEIVLDAKNLKNIDEDFLIYSNDPENPVKSIHITAEVYEDFSSKMFKAKTQ